MKLSGMKLVPLHGQAGDSLLFLCAPYREDGCLQTTLSQLVPSWISRLRNNRNINFCCLKPTLELVTVSQPQADVK